MSSLMQIVCGWCGAHLGWTVGEGVSHGICANCLKEQEQELEKMKAETAIRNHLQDDPATCWNSLEGEP